MDADSAMFENTRTKTLATRILIGVIFVVSAGMTTFLGYHYLHTHRTAEQGGITTSGCTTMCGSLGVHELADDKCECNPVPPPPAPPPLPPKPEPAAMSCTCEPMKPNFMGHLDPPAPAAPKP